MFSYSCFAFRQWFGTVADRYLHDVLRFAHIVVYAQANITTTSLKAVCVQYKYTCCTCSSVCWHRSTALAYAVAQHIERAIPKGSTSWMDHIMLRMIFPNTRVHSTKRSCTQRLLISNIVYGQHHFAHAVVENCYRSQSLRVCCSQYLDGQYRVVQHFLLRIERETSCCTSCYVGIACLPVTISRVGIF